MQQKNNLISHTIGSSLSKRENNFDFLRFFAATLVIYSHSYPLTGNEYSQHEPFSMLIGYNRSLGFLALSIFFTIGGFLVSKSYCNSENPVQFVKNRVLRIFPGLFFVLLLTVFILGPIVTELTLNEYFSSETTYQYLLNVFLYPIRFTLPGVFIQNPYAKSVNGALWSIPIEVFFYGIILALGVLNILKNKKVNFFIFVLAICLYSFESQLFVNTKYFFTMNTHEVLELYVFFSTGMLAFSMRDYIVLDKYIAIICLFGLLMCYSFSLNQVGTAIFQTYLIMFFAFNEKIKLYNFAKYGDFSYGLYLYGFLAQQTVSYFLKDSVTPLNSFLLGFSIALLLAILSYNLIEKKFLRLKNKVFFKNKVA